MLQAVVAAYRDPEETEEVVEELINKKLLLFRRHSGEVALWHGTDFDLRSRLEEEKERRTSSFDPVKLIQKECPPPCWLPQQYNDKFAILRYCRGVYLTLDDLSDHLGVVHPEVYSLDGDADGRVAYVLPETSIYPRY